MEAGYGIPAWLERWLTFIQSEIDGTRRIASLFSAFFVGLLGSFFAAVLNLAQPNGLPSIPVLTGAFYLWATVSVSLLTYMWVQYLGALKGFLKDYLMRSLDVRKEPDDPSKFRVHLSELIVRDPGYLMELMITKRRGREFSQRLHGSWAFAYAIALRVGFFGVALSSAGAYVLLFLGVLKYAPFVFAAKAFGIATVLVVILSVIVALFVRSVKDILQTEPQATVPAAAGP